MSRCYRIIQSLGLLFAAHVAMAQITVAQSPYGTAIPPELCTVAPLTEEELVGIVTVATPAPAATEWVGGALLPDEEREPIVATVTESIACANANDPLRSFALFTDRYLQARFTGAGADDLGHLLAAITRDPAPAEEEDRLSLFSMDEFTSYDDGRVSVVVVTGNATTTFTDTLLLVEVDGRWLIDGAVTTNPPVPATPAA